MMVEVDHTLVERAQQLADMAGDETGVTLEFIVNEALEAYLSGVDEALWEAEHDDV